MANSAHGAGAAFRDIKKHGRWRRDGSVKGYMGEADFHAFNERAVRFTHVPNLNEAPQVATIVKMPHAVSLLALPEIFNRSPINQG